MRFPVDHALDHAKSVGKGSNDGDIHVSGRSPKVGLPMVAEVINARLEKPMIDLFQNAIAGAHSTAHRAAIWTVCVAGGLAPLRPATSIGLLTAYDRKLGVTVYVTRPAPVPVVAPVSGTP